MVNAEKYLAFLRAWKSNPLLAASLRAQMPLDATPALRVRDPRVKAAFSMAPGVFPGFGMDEEGLAQLKIPAYIIVGAQDTQTPAEEHAAFAARHAPRTLLEVLPGPVDHEIFVNECDTECDTFGRDMMPAGCVDPAGVDRAALHQHIGARAVVFFDDMLKVSREVR